MITNLRTFIACVLGPRIYTFYKLTGNTLAYTTPEILSRTHQYQANTLENVSDKFIRVTKIVTSFGSYISPFLFTYLLYKRSASGSFVNSLDHTILIQLFTTAISVLLSSILIRGYARYLNPEYLEFLRVLEDSRKNLNPSNKRILAHFDVDFSAFPIDFKWSQAKDKRPPERYKKTFPTAIEDTFILDNNPLKLPLELVMSIAMKTVGRRLIYPGSLGPLQALMQPAITAGRAKLVEEHDGIRYKLESSAGNIVDTMFIDKRASTPNGDYLVIGCEGNGGFYELGTILTPLEAGYSVLGWNHPGFGGSTGTPYPDEDVAALDTVIKFATDKLNFTLSQIVLYGWSIGGFASSWGAMRYPTIHGLVIDASFDHILPLARGIFPAFLYPLIELGVKQHFDLNNSRHLEYFHGPVLLIRRSQDEVIATDPFNSPPTNRANNLLIDILKQRFPSLMNQRALTLLNEYLAGNTRYQDGILRRYSVNNSTCLRLLLDYLHINPISYPIQIGDSLDNVTRDQLVLYLASKHMIDYDSVHCAPLPPRYFHRPWNLLGLALNGASSRV